VTACNARPPAGHPWHGTLVACHFRAGHLGRHAWDIRAAADWLVNEIETASTIGGLCSLLDGMDADLPVRGSLVIWGDDGMPLRLIGLAPEYDDPPEQP
jgi:hypothetical protein